MQHVNDDMDDVFRKAGENYPLQTGKPDWDKVHAAVMQAEGQEKQKTGTSKKHVLWLLLLLPLPFICNKYWSADKENTYTTVARTPAPHSESQPANSTVVNKVKTKAAQYSISQHQISGQRNKVYKNKHSFASTNLNDVKKTPGKQRNTSIQAPAPTNRLVQNTRPAAKTLTNQPQALSSRTTEAIEASITARGAALQVMQSSAVFETMVNALRSDTSFHKRNTRNTANRYDKGFYIGIMGSADLTSVHMQKISNIGGQAGLLLGYKFRGRWSLETGAYISKKFYYTEGDYFSKSRTYLPPNSKITEVDGSCVMLEIPLAVKYDIASRKRSTLFAATGLTSYIMKKEEYDFLYYYGNSGTYATHSKTYKNASTNLFSVLQLSGGYTRRVGKTLAVRMEPYLKLPITGLGYGKLHFLSTGINVGLIRKF